MAIYLKLGGVEGEVTTKGFEKQIEIMSASFGTARNIASAARKTNNRETSEPSQSPFEWATAQAKATGSRRLPC
jgi:type VI secretion system secreted protein Hcp